MDANSTAAKEEEQVLIAVLEMKFIIAINAALTIVRIASRHMDKLTNMNLKESHLVILEKRIITTIQVGVVMVVNLDLAQVEAALLSMM